MFLVIGTFGLVLGIIFGVYSATGSSAEMAQEVAMRGAWVRSPGKSLRPWRS